MTSFIRHGSWELALAEGALDLFQTGPALPNSGVPPEGVGRVAFTVEVLWAISPMRPHGLLVAEFVPGGDDRAVRAVGSGPFELAGEPLVGPLGRRLYRGLPDELAAAAVQGARAAEATHSLGLGTLHFLGGGIDHDSSPFVFERLGSIAAEALARRLSGVDVDEGVRATVSAW